MGKAINVTGYRFIIEKLVLEAYGRNAYLNLTHSAPYSTFQYGVSLGLISRAELEAAEKMYGNLWHYVGD